MLPKRRKKESERVSKAREREQAKILENRSVVINFNKEFVDLRAKINKMKQAKQRDSGQRDRLAKIRAFNSMQRDRLAKLMTFLSKKKINWEEFSKINRLDVSDLIMVYSRRMTQIGIRPPQQIALTRRDERSLLKKMNHFLSVVKEAREKGLV